MTGLLSRLGLSTQPVAWSAAVKAVLAALIVLGAIHLSGEQVAALVVAVESVLGVLVHSRVTPNVRAEAQAVEAADVREQQVVAGLQAFAKAGKTTKRG